MHSFGKYNQDIMDIILNRIAIWKSDFHKGYTTRTVPAGTRYLDPKTGLYVISDKEMARYAKTYKVGDTEFCLFARSFRTDKNGVEKELNAVAKKIDEKTAKRAVMLSSTTSFEYLDYYLKEEEN